MTGTDTTGTTTTGTTTTGTNTTGTAVPVVTKTGTHVHDHPHREK
ncbi:hypothetical protein ABZV87_06430 [Streptomyces tendae]